MRGISGARSAPQDDCLTNSSVKFDPVSYTNSALAMPKRSPAQVAFPVIEWHAAHIGQGVVCSQRPAVGG